MKGVLKCLLSSFQNSDLTFLTKDEVIEAEL